MNKTDKTLSPLKLEADMQTAYVAFEIELGCSVSAFPLILSLGATPTPTIGTTTFTRSISPWFSADYSTPFSTFRIIEKA